MSRYIGLDVHSQSTALAIVSESGKRVGHRILPTRAPDLIEVIREIPKPRRLILEEGAQSEWLSQILEPFVDELVVTVPRPVTDRAKNDIEDAFARAEDLRRNAIDKRIFKARPEFGGLRAALKLYDSMTRDVIRAKQRFCSLLLGRGIPKEERDYDPSVEELEALMAKLPSAGLRFAAEARLEQILLLEDLQSRAGELLFAEARLRPDMKYLLSLPGIGNVRAATLLAVVVDPHRFRRSDQFASYCGLGVLTVASGEWVRNKKGQMERARTPMSRGLKRGNALLKTVFCGAAQTIVRQMPEHPLGQHHKALIRRGLSENVARITIARKLAGITLALWKNKEIYDPAKHNVNK